MGKDEIIAQILKEITVDSWKMIDEGTKSGADVFGGLSRVEWERRELVSRVFDAGAQSKEEEIEKHVRANTQAIINAGHVVVLESPLWMGELIGAAADAGSSTALKLLFSSVTPCGKALQTIETGEVMAYCGKMSTWNTDNKVEYCDFCRGRAVGREEERKNFEESRKYFTRTVADTLLGELKEEMRQEGRLDAAKDIIQLIGASIPVTITGASKREVAQYVKALMDLQTSIEKRFGVGE